jgi:hypothetical protein
VDFSVTYETADWSPVRYADYGFIALDITTAPAGTKTTMTLRFINQQGRELGRAIFSRTTPTQPAATYRFFSNQWCAYGSSLNAATSR